MDAHFDSRVLRFVFVNTHFDGCILLRILNHSADDGSILHRIMNHTARNGRILCLIFMDAHFDSRVLRFVFVNAHFDGRILFVILDLACVKVILQTGHVLFQAANVCVLFMVFLRTILESAFQMRHIVLQIRHVAFQPGYILLIVFQLINLIILPFFVVKRVKIFSICGCIIPIPRPRRSSSYLCAAQGEQDAAGEEGGEDGPFQRAAGPFLFTSAPPRMAAANEFGPHHEAAAGGVPYHFVNLIHQRFSFLC